MVRDEKGFCFRKVSLSWNQHPISHGMGIPHSVAIFNKWAGMTYYGHSWTMLMWKCDSTELIEVKYWYYLIYHSISVLLQMGLMCHVDGSYSGLRSLPLWWSLREHPSGLSIEGCPVQKFMTQKGQIEVHIEQRYQMKSTGFGASSRLKLWVWLDSQWCINRKLI